MLHDIEKVNKSEKIKLTSLGKSKEEEFYEIIHLVRFSFTNNVNNLLPCYIAVNLDKVPGFKQLDFLNENEILNQNDDKLDDIQQKLLSLEENINIIKNDLMKTTLPVPNSTIVSKNSLIQSQCNQPLVQQLPPQQIVAIQHQQLPTHQQYSAAISKNSSSQPQCVQQFPPNQILNVRQPQQQSPSYQQLSSLQPHLQQHIKPHLPTLYEYQQQSYQQHLQTNAQFPLQQQSQSEFITVRRKPRKQLKSVKGSNKQGTCPKSAGLIAKKKYVFISNLDKSITVDCLTNHLTSNNIPVLNCQEEKSKYGKGFKICIDKKHETDILNPEIWDDETNIRDCVFKSKSNNVNNTNDINVNTHKPNNGS